jgi:outer membrane protein assembly factor BamB
MNLALHPAAPSRPAVACLALAILCSPDARADWPMLHANPQHTGLVETTLGQPLRLVWVRHIDGERLATAMEPIVGEGRVFVATHRGGLYALDALSGEAVWRFQTEASFLHSPAYGRGLVVAGSTDGHLYAIDAQTGRPAWSLFLGHGGFSASPVIAEDKVFIGDRLGQLAAASLTSGRLLWKASFGVPIRQTAAFADGRVFVTAEDLQVRCLSAARGTMEWVSPRLSGQTCRDYYPVVVRSGGRTLVVVRTNPVVNMARRITEDRSLLCRNAGIDDSDWRKLEAWTQSDKAQGDPDLWDKEQSAIVKAFQDSPESRSFFVFDAVTGRETAPCPVLWIAGCQGVGVPPVLTPGGQLLVFYRTAYGNWNRGVAPLVALGLLDLSDNRIRPLFHRAGPQPPWNTFWGTADESQNFVMAGSTAVIAHQGTLSRFDLDTGDLSLIGGNRDTFGGFPGLPWARNEWHGPGRGGAAIDGDRIYWLTGSRILCMGPTGAGKQVEDRAIEGGRVATCPGQPVAPLADERVTQLLADSVAELLSKRWAPLFMEPGLAGRDLSFTDSGEVLEALAWAYPHLGPDLQAKSGMWLAEEWKSHPPLADQALYSLDEGSGREYFSVPHALRGAPAGESRPHRFANAYAVWLYADRCGRWDVVMAAWPQLRSLFEDFRKTGWRLEGSKGDLFANRYLASLTAFGRIAEKAGDTRAVEQARGLASLTTDALVAWWQRAAASGTLTAFNGASQLDPFIGKGDAISFRVTPHRHKLALLAGLSPEVAAAVRSRAPEAVEKVWRTIDVLYPTWSLAGEERQVHSGENFIDPPGLSLGCFEAMAWLINASSRDQRLRLDIPFCRADLTYITKLALILEREKAH